MGGTWEANIYCNNERVTTLKLENDFSLSTIRSKCGSHIPSGETYYFISQKGFLLTDEYNYKAKDAWKEDGNNGYRIDLKTKEFHNKESILVNVFLNEQNPSAIHIKHDTELQEIKKKAYNDKDEKSIYLVTKDNILIDNTNLGEFKLKHVIKYDNGKRIIKMFEKDQYNRIQVIEHLRKLEEITKNGTSIDWYKEKEFFKKIDVLAGSTIAKAIKDDLQGKNNETPGNNDEANKIKSDKEYIEQYLKCLLNEDDSSSAPTYNQ